MLGRIFYLLLVFCFTTSPVWAQTAPFVGQWKLLNYTDQMKVTKVGANRYAFNFGGGAETIVVDGTEQPGIADTTLSVAAEGPNWKVIRKEGGRVLLTATWTLSEDGNSLNDDFTGFNRDGSTSNTKFVYARRAAGSGFAGSWYSTPTAPSSPLLLQVHRYDRNGLSFIFPSQTLNVNFDGKYHPDAGTNSALSARWLNGRTVEISRNSKGKIVQTRQFELSTDLKTLAMRVRTAGADEPNVYVFERP